jgi:excisionase family DNA binding protein
MSNLQHKIEDLSARVSRLESAQQRPRGRTNLAGAARYLNVSEETLRKRLASGGGPRGARNGRFWSFTYDDLDQYAESGVAPNSA